MSTAVVIIGLVGMIVCGMRFFAALAAREPDKIDSVCWSYVGFLVSVCIVGAGFVSMLRSWLG